MLELTRNLPALGRCEPATLVDARLELHWAAQLLAAWGQNFAEPQEDDTHRNLGWRGRESETDAAFLSVPSKGGAGLQLALTVPRLELRLAEDGEPDRVFSLQGRSLEDGYAWLADVTEHMRPAGAQLERPEYDMPDHAVGRGASFQYPESVEMTELAAWYDVAQLVLEALRRKEPNASSVRTWPHHFDIATLLSHPSGESSESDRSVGVGMTPGDGGYPEPYWYVTPYPYPDDPDLPELPFGGHWHTDGWTGAVLQASEHERLSDPATQARQVLGFVENAVAGARKLLGL